MLEENKNQLDALRVLGFVSNEARRNIIIFLLVAAWTAAGYGFYQWKTCENQHRTTIQAQQAEILRLIDKYEGKIEKLNSDLNSIKK